MCKLAFLQWWIMGHLCVPPWEDLLTYSNCITKHSYEPDLKIIIEECVFHLVRKWGNDAKSKFAYSFLPDFLWAFCCQRPLPKLLSPNSSGLSCLLIKLHIWPINPNWLPYSHFARLCRRQGNLRSYILRILPSKYTFHK